MWSAKNQAELVEQKLGVRAEIEKDNVVVPGIKTLHTRSVEDIAETLAVVLRSRPNIVSFKFVVGSHVEVEFTPADQPQYPAE